MGKNKNRQEICAILGLLPRLAENLVKIARIQRFLEVAMKVAILYQRSDQQGFECPQRLRFIQPNPRNPTVDNDVQVLSLGITFYVLS